MAAPTATRATSAAGDARSWTPRGLDDTEIRILLAAAMVVSVALGLWFSRDTAFSADEVSWFSTSPHLDPRGALEPYNGHLILTTRLVYAAIFNAFGPDYISFRLLTAGAVVLTAGLFFVFAERRVGALCALAPTLPLLFYGSASVHVLSGNGFTVALSLAAGIGALLALEREDRAGDIGACLLLSLAVATYTVGLSFIVGAGTLILIGKDRWRRIWVFVVPGLLYAAWLLWSRHLDTGASDITENQVAISNLLLAPDWAFDSLRSAGSALLGLDYDFGGEGPALDTPWGPVVAAIALVALGWRLSRGKISKWLWAAMAVAASMWLIEAVAAQPPSRVPDHPRYVLPVTIAILLVAVEAFRGTRLGRRGVIVVYLVVAVSLATNIALLRDSSRQLRTVATRTRTELSAFELAGGRIGPGSTAGLLGARLRATGGQKYEEAVEQFGSPGFSLATLRAQAEGVREHADAVLADSFGLHLQPTSTPPRDCRRVAGKPGEGTVFRVPSGGAVLRANGSPSELRLRRFGSAFTVEAGTLEPGTPAALVLPSDSAPDPWYASTPASAVEVCK
jgi:hypothetical protein